MRKLSYLQGLRGAAAFIVVLTHYACAFYPQAIFGVGQAHATWETFLWSTPLGFVVAGRSAVCLFFILSGYVLSLPYVGPEAKADAQLTAAMLKRPVRLGGLVAAAMIISAVLAHLHVVFDVKTSLLTGSSWLRDTPIGSLVPWSHFAKDLAHLFNTSTLYDNPLWTISFELLGSYLTFVFLLIFRRTWLRWFAYIALFLNLSDDLYMGFIIGIFFADVHKTFPSLISRAHLSYLIVPMLAGGVYLAAYPISITNEQLMQSWYAVIPHGHHDRYLMAGAFLIFLAVTSAPTHQRVFSSSVFVYIGRISYAMYAVHVLVIASFSSWLFQTLYSRFSYNQAFLLMFVPSLLLTLIVSHILTVWFDEKVTALANRLAQFWFRVRDQGSASRS